MRIVARSDGLVVVARKTRVNWNECELERRDDFEGRRHTFCGLLTITKLSESQRQRQRQRRLLLQAARTRPNGAPGVLHVPQLTRPAPPLPPSPRSRDISGFSGLCKRFVLGICGGRAGGRASVLRSKCACTSETISSGDKFHHTRARSRRRRRWRRQNSGGRTIGVVYGIIGLPAMVLLLLSTTHSSGHDISHRPSD